jgi:hypothetical protein
VTKRNKTAKDTRHNHDHPNTYEITFQGKTHRIEIKASTLSLLNSSDPDLYARGVDQELNGSFDLLLFRKPSILKLLCEPNRDNNRPTLFTLVNRKMC